MEGGKGEREERRKRVRGVKKTAPKNGTKL